MILRSASLLSLLLMLLTVPATTSFAEDSDKPHKVVIQVSTGAALSQKVAINNAEDLQESYGSENIHIVVVAYGPGLTLLKENSPSASRIESLAAQGVVFVAGAQGMKKLADSSGGEPALLESVEVVPLGVVRVLELQEQGYAYIRP